MNFHLNDHACSSRKGLGEYRPQLSIYISLHRKQKKMHYFRLIFYIQTEIKQAEKIMFLLISKQNLGHQNPKSHQNISIGVLVNS